MTGNFKLTGSIKHMPYATVRRAGETPLYSSGLMRMCAMPDAARSYAHARALAAIHLPFEQQPTHACQRGGAGITMLWMPNDQWREALAAATALCNHCALKRGVAAAAAQSEREGGGGGGEAAAERRLSL
jgi:hypothetical protein